MLGSAAATLAVGRWGHRFELRRLLIAAAALMVATGAGFAAFSSLWPLLVVALAGTMNPGGGDVSVFYPLEHTALAAATAARRAPAPSRATASSARCSGRRRARGAQPGMARAGHGLTMLDALS
jgi:MFS family permease